MLRISKIAIISILVIAISSVSFGKNLTVGVGIFEPFFVQKDESGVFLDLIKETFKLMPQYKVKFVFINNRRLLTELNNGILDAAANIFKGSETNACLSEPMFRYTDVAVSLKSRNLVINSISDLQDKTIAAYENATDLLGEEFKKMAASNPGYRECAEPYITTNLMVGGRKDVRIGDLFIFLYDLNRPQHKGKVRYEDFVIHSLFPPVYSHMGFKDKKICEDFDDGLRKIKKNGIFEAVYKKYEFFLKIGMR